MCGLSTAAGGTLHCIALKNLLAATADIIPLEKLRGPGSVYRHLSLPEGLSLNFIIQGRSIVETHFSIETNGTRHESSFAILSKELTEFAGTAKHVHLIEASLLFAQRTAWNTPVVR